MNHRWIATIVVMFLAASAFVSCGGDKPKRNKKFEDYADFKGKGKSHEGSGAAELETGDGEFGPSGGNPTTLSSDDIMTKLVANAGAIKGQCKYQGTPRKPRAVDMSKDKWCAANHTVFPEDILVSDQGGLRNVVVYVSKGFNRFEFEPPTDKVLLDQRGCKYIPHVLCGVAGQDVQVRNSDDTSHNYNFSASKNPGVNQTQPKPGTNTESIFVNPDLSGSFQCDIHGWMKAPVRVFSHPYFAVSDDEGNFEIKNLPAGTYQISFLHERSELESPPQSVTVTSGETASIGATFGG